MRNPPGPTGSQVQPPANKRQLTARTPARGINEQFVLACGSLTATGQRERVPAGSCKSLPRSHGYVRAGAGATRTEGRGRTSPAFRIGSGGVHRKWSIWRRQR